MSVLLGAILSGDGKQTVDFSGEVGFSSAEKARAVLVQNEASGNGSGIVVAGQVGASDFGLVRLTTSGSLDSTFGTGGRVITDGTQASGNTTIALALAQQGDGKLPVTGQGSTGGQGAFTLARYHASTHPEERVYPHCQSTRPTETSGTPTTHTTWPSTPTAKSWWSAGAAA